MLHNPKALLPVSDRSSEPLRGDVVVFRFPASEDGDGNATPKRPPCLMLNAFARERNRSVELADGTWCRSQANRSQKVIVRQPPLQVPAGLVKANRFVCARRLTVHNGLSVAQGVRRRKNLLSGLLTGEHCGGNLTIAQSGKADGS